MAIIKTKPKTNQYGDIQRGCSLSIPVSVKHTAGTPYDLSGFEVAFTAKAVRADSDTRDTRAYISKTFEPHAPVEGYFFVQLSSEDTDFDEGEYYFDIELFVPSNGAVHRLCTLTFNLVGGPTNRTVNPGMGQLAIGEEISVTTLEQGRPIVVLAPAFIASREIYDNVHELMIRMEAAEIQIREVADDVEELVERFDRYQLDGAMVFSDLEERVALLEGTNP